MTKRTLRKIETALYCEFSKCKILIGYNKNINGEKFKQLFFNIKDILSYYSADELKEDELKHLEKFISGEYARVLNEVAKFQKVHDYD